MLLGIIKLGLGEFLFYRQGFNFDGISFFKRSR